MFDYQYKIQTIVDESSLILCINKTGVKLEKKTHHLIYEITLLTHLANYMGYNFYFHSLYSYVLIRRIAVNIKKVKIKIQL